MRNRNAFTCRVAHDRNRRPYLLTSCQRRDTLSDRVYVLVCSGWCRALLLLTLHNRSWGRIMMSPDQGSEVGKDGNRVTMVDRPAGCCGGIGGRDDRGVGPESADARPAWRGVRSVGGDGPGHASRSLHLRREGQAGGR